MYLIIETATSRGLIALVESGIIIGHTPLTLGLGKSSDLEPALEKMMHKAPCSFRELQYVAVGHGPGSYTGLRVGVASAKAISIACNIPLVGISSLKGFIPPDEYEGTYVVAIDAKIGGVYTLYARKEKNVITYLGDESLERLEIFEEKLPSVGCLVTPAWGPLKSRLNVLPLVFEAGPSALQLSIVAEAQFQKKCYTCDGALPLLYLRPTQAEMEKLRNKPDLQ